MPVQTDREFNITKSDSDKRLVFGWANVAIRKNGEQIVDYQGDMFDPEDLEEAAYKYVLNFRDAGEEHIPSLRKKAKLVESVVFTKEKMAAMGIPEGTVPEGWWIGFKVHDDKAWELIKNGTYRMFSIEGAGIREEVLEDDLKKSEPKSLTFAQMLQKFNPYHDARGRFSSADGAASFTYAPGRSKAHDLAIQREKERHAATGGAEEKAKRISAAEDSIRAVLKDGAEVKLEGVDPELAESTAESVKMVLERYPKMKDAFGGFTTDEPSAGYFEENPGVYACYAPNTTKIHLNKKVYADKEAYEKKYQEAVSRKHFPEGTTYKSSIAHEMGHALDYYVSYQNFGSYRVNWEGETVSKRIWNNDIRAGKRKGEPVTGKSIREGLSGYASKNNKEYLAEAFSEVMTSPNPRPMAKSIVKRMDTYVKKAEKQLIY